MLTADKVIAIVCSAISLLILVPVLIYGLVQFCRVKDNLIFKKRHSELTIIFLYYIRSIHSWYHNHNGRLCYFNEAYTASIFLFQQYLSVWIVIIYTFSIEFGFIILISNIAKQTTNNEWKSLIDPDIYSCSHNEINWNIDIRINMEIQILVQISLCIYLVTIIPIYMIEGYGYESTEMYNKCYPSNYNEFKYRVTTINYENDYVVLICLFALIPICILRSKTPRFDDTFVRQEIKICVSLGLFMIILNIPHMLVAMSVIWVHWNIYIINMEEVVIIWRSLSCLTILEYNFFGCFIPFMTFSLWSIHKNKKWLSLFDDPFKSKRQVSTSARESLHLEPLHKSTGSAAISPVSLHHQLYARSTSPESPDVNRTQRRNSKKGMQIKTKQERTDLVTILNTEEGFNTFMFHLAKEFSIEIMISLIEIYQYKSWMERHFEIVIQSEDNVPTRKQIEIFWKMRTRISVYQNRRL